MLFNVSQEITIVIVYGVLFADNFYVVCNIIFRIFLKYQKKLLAVYFCIFFYAKFDKIAFVLNLFE